MGTYMGNIVGRFYFARKCIFKRLNHPKAKQKGHDPKYNSIRHTSPGSESGYAMYNVPVDDLAHTQPEGIRIQIALLALISLQVTLVPFLSIALPLPSVNACIRALIVRSLRVRLCLTYRESVCLNHNRLSTLIVLSKVVVLYDLYYRLNLSTRRHVST